MRHHVDGKKLGRTSSHRKAMFANMASSLIRHDRIETTLPKAKELRRLADRLVTMGKQQSLSARRRAVSIIRDKGAVHKLFGELAPRFTDRKGGYTRILKLGFRHGDAAPMAMIEYLSAERKGGEEEKAAGEKKSKAAKKKEHAERKAAAKGAKMMPEKGAKPAKQSAPAMKHSAKRASPAHKATRSGEK